MVSESSLRSDSLSAIEFLLLIHPSFISTLQICSLECEGCVKSPTPTNEWLEYVLINGGGGGGGG